MSYNFLFFSNFFVSKAYVFESFHGSLFIWTLWVFLLGFPNLKITSITLNTSFHIDLGMFMGD